MRIIFKLSLFYLVTIFFYGCRHGEEALPSKMINPFAIAYSNQEDGIIQFSVSGNHIGDDSLNGVCVTAQFYDAPAGTTPRNSVDAGDIKVNSLIVKNSSGSGYNACFQEENLNELLGLGGGNDIPISLSGGQFFDGFKGNIELVEPIRLNLNGNISINQNSNFEFSTTTSKTYPYPIYAMVEFRPRLFGNDTTQPYYSKIYTSNTGLFNIPAADLASFPSKSVLEIEVGTGKAEEIVDNKLGKKLVSISYTTAASLAKLK